MARDEKKPEEVVVPFDPMNEAAIVAAACVGEEDRINLTRRIPADRFVAPPHLPIWRALAETVRRKMQFSIDTLKLLEPDVDERYVAELVADKPERPPNLEHHVEVLLWDHARVHAAAGPVAELLNALKDPRTAPERVRALARMVGVSFDGATGRRHLLDSSALAGEQVNVMRRRRDGQAIWPYGVEGLDSDLTTGEPRLIPAAMPGMMTVVTGVSGSAKTPLIANLVLGLARQKRRVLYGAWEVRGGMTLEWLALLSLGFNRAEYQLGHFEEDGLEQVHERMRAIGRYVTFLENPFNRVAGGGPQDGRKRRGNSSNLDTVQAYVADSGCDVFVADLFERCLSDTDPDEEKHALFRMQAMLDDLRVHGIFAAQQRLKDIEQRPDKRPTREGIKGSSAWVEVPDTILGTNRPALWRQVPDDTVEVHIMKQRMGRWPMMVELDWSPTHYSLKNGREVPYEHPGERGDDGGVFAPPKKGKKRSEFGRTRRD